MKDKKIVLKIIFTLVFIILIFAVAYYNKMWFFSDLNSGKSSPEKQIMDKKNNKDTQPDKKLNSVKKEQDNYQNKQTTEEKQVREKEKPAINQYENYTPNDNKINAIINYKSVVDNTLKIRVTINELLNSGICAITLTNGDKKVVKKANIAQSSSTSTCQGFDVSISELTSGDWNIEIKIDSGDKTVNLKSDIKIGE